MKQRIIVAFPSLHHNHEGYKWWILGNILISTFMSVLSGSLLNIALPDIMASTGMSIDMVQWLTTAYMIAFSIMLPSAAWIANRIGYRFTYVLAVCLFTAASLACGFASGPSSLIVLRCLQGIGAGLISPIGMAITTHEFPQKQRGTALGLYMIAAAASQSLGPTFGGWIVDNFDWHMIFFINVPIGIFCAFFTMLVQREYKHDVKISFDFIGFFSMAVFLTSLVIALSSGNAQWNTDGWGSDFELGCYAIAIISFAVFLATELQVKNPLVNLRLFRRFNFTFVTITLCLAMLGLAGSTFIFPLYLQNSLGLSALQAGAMMLPVGLLQTISSPVAGIVGDRWTPKIPAIAGIVLTALGYYFSSLLSLDTEPPLIYLSLCLRGVGFGIIFTPLMAYIMNGIPRTEMVQASGLSSLVRQIGSSFGVAVFQVILTSRISYHTAVYGGTIDPSTPQYASLMRSLGTFVSQSAGGTVRDVTSRASFILQSNIAKQAFVSAVNDNFILAALSTIGCIVLVLFLRPAVTAKKDPS
jgi:DHA2 family multidrug resistance protein